MSGRPMFRTERDRVPAAMPLATGPDQLIITVRQSGETAIAPDDSPAPTPRSNAAPERLFTPEQTMRGQTTLGL